MLQDSQRATSELKKKLTMKTMVRSFDHTSAIS
uniref:Uncharacterized protein n=1 Tax=Arundo donax TaxID=35708 RepID=A0A0A9DNT4_ARUDO